MIGFKANDIRNSSLTVSWSDYLYKFMPFQGYYTSKEVTELLRIDPQTLLRWVKKGQLERIRIGNMSFYRVGDIEEYVKKMNVDQQ